jgi:hypothetical protein
MLYRFHLALCLDVKMWGAPHFSDSFLGLNVCPDELSC